MHLSITSFYFWYIGEMDKKVGGHGGMDFTMDILSIILHL